MERKEEVEAAYLEKILCGSLNENLSERMFNRKDQSMSTVLTEKRKLIIVIFAVVVERPDTTVNLPAE